ncbi:GrpB family protein [Allobacillus sp. GCM10007491]|uniref:GrpB family protein n=1 Tax=Allobacillus saliphilus TaxID=2912308 RepID=A0A941CU85_9BACI|nr:GrpB family protein [Allobacillus saliphilus]MBR7554038.1 GrpB family protein [Allobacillus saliphilus]
MRKVEVTAYNEKWPILFQEEAERLKNVFGVELLEIHHIGSTSIPGLSAKPIIDMMPVVKSIEKIDAVNEKMKELGYLPKGEFGIPGRRYFPKAKENRTHHVHIFQEGSSHIHRHLVFRDYLRSHPTERGRYGLLKVNLAKKFPTDMVSYIKGKENLIKELEQKALIWHKERQNLN